MDQKYVTLAFSLLNLQISTCCFSSHGTEEEPSMASSSSLMATLPHLGSSTHHGRDNRFPSRARLSLIFPSPLVSCRAPNEFNFKSSSISLRSRSNILSRTRQTDLQCNSIVGRPICRMQYA
ncbi:hypothetical protein Scep_019821 [Stephania cephalantha]|uniref:Uncharacterized protein n=1 Tax=Stephania cephalantha TaxID=152367 RepID=A0AAP0IBQ8_9MAGN